MCNGETAAGSRLLGCTNSPETRLARVLFFASCDWIRSPSLACHCFPHCSFIRMRCVIMRHIFFSPSDPLDPTKPPPSLRMYSTYTKLGYLPWTFSPVSPGQQKKEGSPLLALYAAELLMLSLMAVDGRRQPLALALERGALLINQNQPSAITSIFWVNYREGQVAQAGFRMRL